MGITKDYLGLRLELTPFMRKLAGDSDYQRFRLTFEDMMGFFEEKLILVWHRYHERLPYEEVKALGIASIYNIRTKVAKKFSREVSMDDREVADIAVSAYQDYLALALPHLNDGQAFLLELVIDPPMYIKDRCTEGKRIPSRLILDYLDYPKDGQAVKKMNAIRRGIFTTLEQAVLK